MIAWIRRHWRGFWAPWPQPGQTWHLDGIGMVMVMAVDFEYGHIPFTWYYRITFRHDTMRLVWWSGEFRRAMRAPAIEDLHHGDKR